MILPLTNQCPYHSIFDRKKRMETSEERLSINSIKRSPQVSTIDPFQPSKEGDFQRTVE